MRQRMGQTLCAPGTLDLKKQFAERAVFVTRLARMLRLTDDPACEAYLRRFDHWKYLKSQADPVKLACRLKLSLKAAQQSGLRQIRCAA